MKPMVTIAKALLLTLMATAAAPGAVGNPDLAVYGTDGSLCVVAGKEHEQEALEPVLNADSLLQLFGAEANMARAELGLDYVSLDDSTEPNDGFVLSPTSDYVEVAFFDHQSVDEAGLHHYLVTGVSERYGCMASAFGCTIEWPMDNLDTDKFEDKLEHMWGSMPTPLSSTEVGGAVWASFWFFNGAPAASPVLDYGGDTDNVGSPPEECPL